MCLMFTQEYIVPALQDKMKYLRNYNGNKVEQTKGEKSAKWEAKPSYPKAPPLASSIIIDESAVERHMKLLQKEEKKVSPSKHIISELMDKTFNHRRRDLLEGVLPVSKIISIYPALSRSHHVSKKIILHLNR